MPSTRTAQTQSRLKDDSDPDAVIATLIANHAMKQLAQPEEIAAAALFLASDESSFVTGAALPFDGARPRCRNARWRTADGTGVESTTRDDASRLAA